MSIEFIDMGNGEKPQFPPFPTDGTYFRNPSTGEIIDTPEKYEVDIQGMWDRANAEREAGIEPKSIDEILGDS